MELNLEYYLEQSVKCAVNEWRDIENMQHVSNLRREYVRSAILRRTGLRDYQLVKPIACTDTQQENENIQSSISFC